MRGRNTGRVLIGLGVLACLLLLVQVTGLVDFTALGSVEPEEEPDALAALEQQLFAEMRQGATLRGLPGLETRERGHGILTGAVKLHVANAGPQPLPSVIVQVLGHGTGPEGKFRSEVETDAEGVFKLLEVPAHVGYVILVDHRPYRRSILRGVSVAADRTSDVGTLLLGAPTSLRGEVVDSRGRPVAGARVGVLRARGQSGSFDIRTALFELESATTYLAEATATGDGRFVLEDLPPGRYILRVAGRGYATTFRDGVLVTVDENSTPVRVVLDPGSGFYGRVLDDAGRGIGGARVIAIALPGKGMSRVDKVEVSSAGDGSYRLDTLVSGMSYGVEAWAEGYAPTGRYLPSVSGMREFDFKLAGSGAIEGRITDAETGVAIPDAQVTVVAGAFNGLSPVSTVTDASGGFLLAHVNPGPIIVFSAKAEGFQPGDKADFQSVNGMKVVAGETTWVDWTLRAGGSVSGRVTSDAGKPVSYASLALIDRKKSRQRWTGEITGMTDADGSYELIGVRPGTYDLHVNAAGYAPPTGEAATKVEMGKDLVAVQKDVVVARGATLQGVVTGPDDVPVRGARVWLEGPTRGSTPSNLRDLQVVSGVAGRYRIQGVPPSAHLVLAADHDAFVSGRSKPLRLAAGQARTVNVRMREGVSLPGRAVDTRGSAVPNARVRWGNIDGVGEKDLRESFSADEFLGSRVLRTDADGRFLIERLPEGRLLLKIEHEDFAAWYRKDLRIGISGPQPAVTAELSATLTVSGTVRGADTGKPLAGAFVYARERGPGEGRPQDPGRVQAIVSAETDARGGYVLHHVPPGLHEIVVWFADGYIAAAMQWRHEKVRRKDVSAGAKGIDFDLDPVVPPGAEGE